MLKLNHEARTSFRPSVRAGESHVLLRGFSLLEMLVVVAIIGILSGLALPALKGLGSNNVMASASRQILDDLALARTRAIAERSTVYVVFFPRQSQLGWGSTASGYFVNDPAANALLGSQLSAYALFSSHSVGDQPGQGQPRYLTSWRHLPETVFFATDNNPMSLTDQNAFIQTNTVKFLCPSLNVPAAIASALQLSLPWIAFNPDGRLVNHTRDVRIRLARGSLFYSTFASGLNVGKFQALDPNVVETPIYTPGEPYTSVVINWLTGRARIEHWPPLK